MQDVTISGTESLPVCTFTLEGFSFSGWNTKADGSGTTYADKGYCTPKEDMTLYAQWGEPKASVTTTSGTTTSYATLAAALAAAPGNSTITLEANSTTPASGLTITKSITLDLNGRTIEAASNQYESLLVVAEQGSLTIKDGKGTGSITSEGKGSNPYTIKNSGTLTIEGGTIKNTGTTENSYTISTMGGTVTINGGTISSTSANAINKPSFAADKVTLTVSGGTISSTNADAIALGSDDTITISGGTISSEKGAAIKSSLGGTATISGGTIKSNGTYAISGLDIILSGNPTIQGKNADICLRSYNSYWKNNKIAGSLTMATPLKITDGKATTEWYSTSTVVFTADTGYTITSDDVAKLSFVDSTGAVYKAVVGSITYTYNLELSGSSIVLKETPNY